MLLYTIIWFEMDQRSDYNEITIILLSENMNNIWDMWLGKSNVTKHS